MNDYEARKAAKAERYRQYAANAAARAEAASRTSRQMYDAIPFGQPILVGHYSEGRDRRYRDRAWNLMGKGVEQAERADYWERRAEAVESDTSISSADPDAVPKLEAKIAELEAQAEQIKASNKARRKAGQEGTPAYVLANLRGNIGRYKQRLASLQDPRPLLRYLYAVRYAGACRECDAAIAKGAQALYDKRAQELVCLGCGPSVQVR